MVPLLLLLGFGVLGVKFFGFGVQSSLFLAFGLEGYGCGVGLGVKCFKLSLAASFLRAAVIVVDFIVVVMAVAGTTMVAPVFTYIVVAL